MNFHSDQNYGQTYGQNFKPSHGQNYNQNVNLPPSQIQNQGNLLNQNQAPFQGPISNMAQNQNIAQMKSPSTMNIKAPTPNIPPIQKVYSEPRQYGNFIEIVADSNQTASLNAVDEEDLDPAQLFTETSKLNVVEVCEKTKQQNTSVPEFEFYKTKWKLDKLKITEDQQNQLFNELRQFISSMVLISGSIAKSTEGKVLERKHVEFAYLKTEGKLLVDSEYVPKNHSPSKKHLKRLNLLNTSKNIKK